MNVVTQHQERTLPMGVVAHRSRVPGYVMLSVLQWLRRSRSLKLLKEIEHEPFRSKAEVESNQLGRLSRLLAHAEKHVPYYRELFRSLNMTSRDIRSLKDLAQL